MAVKDFHIRPARHDDADFLLPLINRAGEGIPEYIWAELEGRPAGCLIAYQQPDVAPPLDPDLPSMLAPLQELENEAPGTGYVYVLSTAAGMRGRGVGTRLLDFAERYRGPNGMSLIVADNNTGAKKLYERCGYAEAARRRMVKKGWQSEGTDWILMVKP